MKRDFVPLIINENGLGLFANVDLEATSYVQAVDGTPRGPERKAVTFKQGERIAKIELEVTSKTILTCSEGSSWLKGIVTDTEKVPVPGMTVTIYDRYTKYAGVETGTAGKFEFTGLPKGKKGLDVSGRGYKPIFNRSAKVNTTVELQVSSSYSIRVRVVDAETEEAIPLFKVDYFVGMRRNYSSGLTVFSPDGTFILDEFCLGWTSFYVEADGYDGGP